MYLARKNIGIPLDRQNRNNHNDNFEELYNDFNNVVEKVSKEAFDKVIDGSKIDWSAMVDTVDDLPSNAEVGAAHGVKSDNKIYRFDGENWVDIAEINLNPIAEVDDRLTSQLADITTNVRMFGAVGDGETDDTEPIQDAIDYVHGNGGGTVYIPSGKYMINSALSSYSLPEYIEDGGLSLKDNVHVILSPNATLKAIPNNEEVYTVILIKNCTNTSVTGGILEGERDQHEGTEGEWGFGIAILDSEKVEINNTLIKDFWGDGIYIRGRTNNVKINNVVCDNNRRQGMSIVDGRNIYVYNSTFKNTNGADPQTGVDIEPNHDTYSIDNIVFDACHILDNSKQGLIIPARFINIKNIKLENCVLMGNSDDFNATTNSEGKLTGLTIVDSKIDRIIIGKSSSAKGIEDVVIENNEVERIEVIHTDSANITKNTIRGASLVYNDCKNISYIDNVFKPEHSGYRLGITDATNVKIARNTFINGEYAIRLNGGENQKDFILIDNIIDSTETGILITGKNTLVKNNMLKDCDDGIEMYNSAIQNTLKDNMLINMKDKNHKGGGFENGENTFSSIILPPK